MNWKAVELTILDIKKSVKHMLPRRRTRMDSHHEVALKSECHHSSSFQKVYIIFGGL